MSSKWEPPCAGQTRCPSAGSDRLDFESEWPPLGASTKAPATGQEGAEPSDGRENCTPIPLCREIVLQLVRIDGAREGAPCASQRVLGSESLSVELPDAID